VERTSIEMMPLNGRDITQLATLQTGVTLLTTKSSSPTAGQGTNISIAGNRPNQSGFLMDGTDLTGNSGKGIGGVSGAFLGLDTVQEFTVQMSNYSAEYGRAGRASSTSSRDRFQRVMVEGSTTIATTPGCEGLFDHEKPDFRRHQFRGRSVGRSSTTGVLLGSGIPPDLVQDRHPSYRRRPEGGKTAGRPNGRHCPCDPTAAGAVASAERSGVRRRDG
jgi:hypothetical protein